MQLAEFALAYTFDISLWIVFEIDEDTDAATSIPAGPGGFKLIYDHLGPIIGCEVVKWGFEHEEGHPPHIWVRVKADDPEQLMKMMADLPRQWPVIKGEPLFR